MSLKRNYFATGGGDQGYSEEGTPSKMPTPSGAWPNYGQNYMGGGSGRNMYGSGSQQMGMGSPQGGMSKTVDRLKTMSGTTPPSVRFSGFEQGAGDYDYGFNEGGGYGQGGGYDNQGSNYDQGGGGGGGYGQGGGGGGGGYNQGDEGYNQGEGGDFSLGGYNQEGGGYNQGGGGYNQGGGGYNQGGGGYNQGGGGYNQGGGGYNQRGGGYNQGGGGFNQGGGYNEGGVYNAGGGFDQGYGYDDSDYGEQQMGGSFSQGEGDYYGGGSRGGGATMGWGQRGHGRGQGRGQGQAWGRGASGRGNQPAQSRGQARGFVSGGQGSRGRGRGQNQNFQGQRGANAMNNQRGQGGSRQHNLGITPPQRGLNKASRGGQFSGRGAPRGRGGGTGATASQVKSISDNIMGMVTSGSKEPGSAGGRGGQKGKVGAGGKPTSLMDLVDSARQRLSTSCSSISEQANRLAQFVEFFLTCPDRVNGIQTLSNALSASRLNLKIEFEAEELVFVTKPLFTGVLTLGGFFLTRGLGLSKKAVKHDCFQRGVEILRTMKVDEILKLEDCGTEALKQEVQHHSETDFESFRSFLSRKPYSSGISDTNSQMMNIKQELTKQQKQAAENETSEKIRTAAVSESQVAERNFPLSDKMLMLVKEIDKSDTEDVGSSRASRYDVLCFKVGITVTALFRAVDPSQARRFYTMPFKGDPDVELKCEIYYDGVLVGEGQGRPRKEAQAAAYTNIQSRLLSEPIANIVQGAKLPSQPESLPDYFEVIYKGVKPLEGNNHPRLFSLRCYPPDTAKPVDDMVIIESQGETIEDHAYKILEFSASKNSMLLEWKYLDKIATADGFRCEINLNHQKSAVGVGPSKAKSRNTTAAMILMELYQTQDVISFSSKEDFSKAIPVSELTKRAEELKAEGPPRTDRVECYWPDGRKTTESEPDVGKVADGEDAPTEGDAEKEAAKEDTVGAWLNNPNRLWLEDAILEAMESYRKKITLEELIFGPGLSEGMRRFCVACARHCCLSPPSVRSGVEKKMYMTFHLRVVTPQEMVKILHICKNVSGRYSLIRSNKPVSVTQQAEFVRTFPDQWLARTRVLVEAERQKQAERAQAKTEESSEKQEEKSSE